VAVNERLRAGALGIISIRDKSIRKIADRFIAAGARQARRPGFWLQEAFRLCCSLQICVERKPKHAVNAHCSTLYFRYDMLMLESSQHPIRYYNLYSPLWWNKRKQ